MTARSNYTKGLLLLLSLTSTSGWVLAQDVSEDANYGSIDLDGFFTPDPYEVELSAGGQIDASNISGCSGYVSSAPDIELDYSDPASELSFFVVSDSDTTLLINDPSGDWYCNDDFDGESGTNPGVVFSSPSDGVYDIWVGVYSEDNVYDDARLIITELNPPWADGGLSSNDSSSGTELDTSLSAYNTASLEGFFSPDPYAFDMNAGGEISADQISGCSGYVSAAPDLELSYSNPSDLGLSFFVTANVDTTLVINGPDGSWYCNDDFDSVGGTNPGIVFQNGEAGVYDVWVGTYSADDALSSARLVITELEAPWLSDSTSVTETPTPTPGQSGGQQLVSSGTGFVVSRTGHILTNHHVIEGCSRQTFQIRGDIPVESVLLSSNAATDLALLKTELTIEPPLFRGPQNLRLGDEVVVYGFPLLGDLSSQGNLTNGIVSALSGLNDDLSRLQMTAQIQPGNSGGPLFNRAGEIVGVVVETANTEYFRQQRGTDIQNLNFAIRDSLARSFLDTNNVGYELGSADPETRSIADIAEAAQRFTGIIRCYE